MEYKYCPFCGEKILAVAKKCKHCGEFLEENKPQVPVQPKTKNCPYCGEEILATAAKCKHCGELLLDIDKKTKQSDIKEKNQEQLLYYGPISIITNIAWFIIVLMYYDNLNLGLWILIGLFTGIITGLIDRAIFQKK